jgi:hypothetical protein
MWPAEITFLRFIVWCTFLSSLTLRNVRKINTNDIWKQQIYLKNVAADDSSSKRHPGFDLHEAATMLFEFPCLQTRVGPMMLKSVDRRCLSQQAYVRSCTIVTVRRGMALFEHDTQLSVSDQREACMLVALWRNVTSRSVPLGETPSQVWVITLCCRCFKNLRRSVSFVRIDDRRFHIRRYVHWTC